MACEPTGVPISPTPWLRLPTARREPHNRRAGGETRSPSMNSFFKGDLSTAQGRVLAWADSLLVDHAIFRTVYSNFATVIPGRLYRCNHPTPMRIRRFARRYGVTTIVNLRGETGTGSYHLSREAAEKLGIAYHDLSVESRGAPHRDRILRLLGIWRSSAGPVVLYCKSGADRVGLASGLCLLFEGRSAATALRQLSLRFGHIRRARTGI